MEPSHEQLREMYRRMVRIREFEEQAGLLMEQDRVHGSVHLYIGQEAIAIAVCALLTNDDFVTSTHRGHGHLIAKGGDIRRMMAELFGKATGYCAGKGGSKHMCDLELGILGANGIVGAGGPIAVGAGFAAKYHGRGQVAVCFFGDGAAAEGSMHEAGNFAAVRKLPVVFVCENNLYGEFMRYDKHHAAEDVANLGQAWGMPGVVVDGMDVFAVYEAAAEAIARARRGEGPSLLECKTYRFYDHVGRVYGAAPRRPEAEIAAWKRRDPLPHFGAALAEREILSLSEQEAILAATRAEVETAIQFAEESPNPDPRELLTDVYSTEVRA